MHFQRLALSHTDLNLISGTRSWAMPLSRMAPHILLPPAQTSTHEPASYTSSALWLGVSKEITCFGPPSLSILSHPCRQWKF